MTEQIAAIVVASSTRNATRLCNYASTKKKGQTSERFVASAGINGCIPELAEKQMRDNRKRWNKNGERTVTLPSGETTTEGEYVQAYHLIQSIAKDGPGGLDPNNPDDIEKAHEAGIALAADRAGDHRYAAVWTQIDGTTGCIHNHIVIDSIDRSTGRSFDSSLVKHSELVGAHDRVLADLGYQQLNEYAPRGVSKGAEKVEKSEERGLAKHALWEANGREGDEPFSVGVLKHRIRETLAEESFTDLESFSEAARENGVDVQQRGKGITYAMLRHSGEDEEWRPIASSDVRRSSKLGRDFEKAAIEQAAERNRGLEQHSRLDVRLLDGIEESLADKRSIDVDSYESVLKENRIAFDHASDDWAYASMDEPGAHTEMRWRKASSLSPEVTREGAQEIFEYNQGRQARDDIGTGEDRAAGTRGAGTRGTGTRGTGTWGGSPGTVNLLERRGDDHGVPADARGGSEKEHRSDSAEHSSVGECEQPAQRDREEDQRPRRRKLSPRERAERALAAHEESRGKDTGRSFGE